MQQFISVRNNFSHLLYKNILKRIFFRQDPEKVHDRIIAFGKLLGKSEITRRIVSLNFSYQNNALEQNISGIKFKNPVGLAAGFDKNAELTDILPNVGFGFIEVGSITGETCEGNTKPRLWRLKNANSLIVHYGLKNIGAEKIAKNLHSKTFKVPVGISIAKTNSKNTVGIEAGIKDYVKAFKKLLSIGNYFTLNISCPNAYGGQPFTEAKRLDKLLRELDKIKTKKPIFLKISPDLSKSEIDKIIEVSKKHNIQGFICSNLTKNKKLMFKKLNEEKGPARHTKQLAGVAGGGISGKLVEDKANELIKYVYSKTRGKFVIIGVGGVFSAEDAYKKIKLGASLVQLITGMIFEGPQLISEINLGLVDLLKKDGFNNISQAIGKMLENR